MKKILAFCQIATMLVLTFSVPNYVFEPEKAKAAGGKIIDISINDQLMTVIENYKVINKFPVSTGKWDMPTPIGTHQIYNHIPDAYSTLYDLYMPNWMAITPDGGYGIHGLPYWKYDWGNVYEGENHLGWRVSHGCVRLSLDNAKWLYSWAANGTTVMIHNESGVQATIVPPDYSAEIIEQSSPNITLKPGEKTSLSVKLKNIGLHWWYNVGLEPIHLGTINPNDRASGFVSETWLSNNRPANLERSGIANGEEAIFRFTITAPQKMGNYEESFKPVAENYGWFDAPEITWNITVWEPDYSCQWISQSEYPTINRGKTTTMQVQFKNTGRQTWKNFGPNAVHLATSHLKDRSSMIYDSDSWISSNRVVSMDEAEVAPGQVATFTFLAQAPNQAGTYTEYFQLVAEGMGWMEDHGVFWNINVK